MNIDKDKAPFFITDAVKAGLEKMHKLQVIAAYAQSDLITYVSWYEHISDVGIDDGCLAIIRPQRLKLSLCDDAFTEDACEPRLCIFANMKPHGNVSAWYFIDDEAVQMSLQPYTKIERLVDIADDILDRLYANALAIKEQHDVLSIK